ncbi:uncharacterized protein LOC117100104 isoform X2 [Anneissia japonica]|uniref:uncharacterized protein LOC117100104 isoform X2 n=1 Tax=Anneissia japonica TaxID=1529436 RepID=UPI0014258FA5|nr:uncharacterized protein LOC117100104 isoform X2 [Anneissia japonica]
MDGFKLNAAKMRAAQERKNRAQSPETESNWDSTDQEEDDLPQISSEEESSFKYNTKKHTSPNHKSNKSYNNNVSQRSSTPSKSIDTARAVQEERRSYRNSPALSTRSSNKNQKAVNVFVDNGFDSDENESISSTIKRRPKEEVPPYDFKAEVKGAGDSVKRPTQASGKPRKGQLYDAPPKQKSTNQTTPSWDDSDEEKKMLAEIRSEMEKSQLKAPKTHLDVPKGDIRHSQPTSTKSTPNMSKAKKAYKQGKKMTSHSSEALSHQSRQHTAGLVVTASDVDLQREPVSLGNTAKGNQEMVDMFQVATPDEDYPSSSVDDEQTSTRYVYYYEHGSLKYYDTRQGRQEIYMDKIADKSETLVRRGVQEFFAAFRILVDFILILLLETMRFVAFNILQTLIVGIFNVFGDYLLKPILAALFNSILQPLSTFVYNVAIATRTVMTPIGDIIKVILTPFIMLVKAFRLFEINWRSSPPTRLIEDV